MKANEPFSRNTVDYNEFKALVEEHLADVEKLSEHYRCSVTAIRNLMNDLYKPSEIKHMRIMRSLKK